MTLRDDLLPVFQDSRQLVEDLGLRQARVYTRTGTWSAGERHLGELTSEDTEITPRPKVRHQGSNLEVSKITPEFSAGGVALSALSPEAINTVDFYFLVQFGDGPLEPYRLAAIDASKNFSIVLTLEPLNLQTPNEY